MIDAAFWTAFGAIATAAAAIVTAATAVFIALQTRATRKAAEAGERTAEVATESLEIARKEQGHTYFLALEALKSRIDSSLPKITLTTSKDISWPPLVPSNYGEPQPHVSEEPFRLPRDGSARLLVRVPVTIVNDGPRTVSLSLTPEFHRGGKRNNAVVLNPGASVSGFFEVQHSVQEWVEIWEVRDRERTGGPETRFEVTYVDPADTGVVEYHHITFGGSILRPVPDEQGAWVVIADPHAMNGEAGSIGWNVQPTVRRYFLSRSKNLELPEIALEP